MSTLGDRNTLAVRYLTERDEDCIGCHKCEVDCPMGIDIKKGVGQHACIGCGECIDSCNDVLGKRGKPGLIEFRYGTQADSVTKTLPLSQRLGLWDGRRMMVAATVPFCFAVVLFLIYGHWGPSLSVNARGDIVRAAGQVRNGYLLTVGSGLPNPAAFTLSVAGVPGAQITPRTVVVGAHDSRVIPITVLIPASAVAAGRTPIHLRVSSGRDLEEIKTIFYTPAP